MIDSDDGMGVREKTVLMRGMRRRSDDVFSIPILRPAEKNTPTSYVPGLTQVPAGVQSYCCCALMWPVLILGSTRLLITEFRMKGTHILLLKYQYPEF